MSPRPVSKEHTAARVKAWHAAHPERVRAIKGEHKKRNKAAIAVQMREYNRKRLYGVTNLDVARLLTLQDSRCAGCRKTPANQRDTHVDHCHATGKLRGVLCRGCNLILGYAHDDPSTLRRLANYLKRPTTEKSSARH